MAQHPPVRDAVGKFHFHTYDYPDSAMRGPWELSDAQSKRDKLQFYSLVQDLDGLVQEGRQQGVPNIRVTNEGGPITAGGGLRYIKVLSFGNAGGLKNAPTVVITGGIHAREWAAPEIAYLVAEYLVVNYGQVKNPHAQVIRNLVDTRNIHIVPMLNPDGNDFTVFGLNDLDDWEPRLWRKNLRPLPTTAQRWVDLLTWQDKPVKPFRNVKPPSFFSGTATYEVPDYEPFRRTPPGTDPNYQSRTLENGKTGVDLNRNFDTLAWGYDGGPDHTDYDPARETYFGPAVGSERETGNIATFMRRARGPQGIEVMLDYHSYGRFILYPTETAYNGLAPGYIALGSYLQTLIRDQAQQAYKLGTPLQCVGYDTTGAITDHAAQQYRTRAFSIEVEPAFNDSAKFRLPEDRIMATFEENIRGALTAIAVPSGIQFVLDLLDWDVYGRGNRLPE